MTIEKEFFKAFEIKPKKLCFNGDCIEKDEIGYDEKTCDDRCVYITRKYPEITAEILLNLICISSTIYPITINFKEDIDELKEFILGFGIRHNKEIGKQQVQALFEECE